MQFKSIRTKFLAFVLPVVLIGFLVFFGVSYKMSSGMLDENAATIGKGIGKQAALEVQRVFGMNEVQLEAMARDDSMIHGDDATKLAKMQELKRDTDVFSNIGYINLDGTGFDVDNNVLNRADREYFKRAVQTQKTVISEPVISSITGKVVVVIAVPVKDNGVLKGHHCGNGRTFELRRDACFNGDIQDGTARGRR